MLTHYTRDPETVRQILTHGFMWFPNRRRLTELLMPGHDYSRREPQQYGMVSFTEIEPREAAAHRESFGHYGIVVSSEWAARQRAQRVIYVDEAGPLTEALQTLFRIGYHDVTARIRYPDDGVWLMAYENKAAASAIAGSRAWASLLQLWEYLEPASCAAQREWRIVNPEPFYSLSENKKVAIARVSPPHNWAKFSNLVPIKPEDVMALVCRPVDRSALEQNTPEPFRNVPVWFTGG